MYISLFIYVECQRSRTNCERLQWELVSR